MQNDPQDNSSSEHRHSKETELEKWESIHALLKRSVLKAQDAVEIQRAQIRYWLEQLAANLNDSGKVEATSTWKKMNMKLPKTKKSSAGTTITKKRKQQQAGGGSPQENNTTSAKKPRTANNDEEPLPIKMIHPSPGRRINIQLKPAKARDDKSPLRGSPASMLSIKEQQAEEEDPQDETDYDDSSNSPSTSVQDIELNYAPGQSSARKSAENLHNDAPLASDTADDIKYPPIRRTSQQSLQLTSTGRDSASSKVEAATDGDDDDDTEDSDQDRF